MAIKSNYMNRMEVRCMCGSWGRLIGTDQYKGEKQICNFLCHCDNPQVDFDRPFRDSD